MRGEAPQVNTPSPETPSRLRLTVSRKAWVIAGVLLAALLLWVYFNSPDESRGYLPCLWHHWTGWHCPGCGGQRALYHLLHTEPIVAWSYNPLLVLAMAAASVLLLADALWGCPAWLRRRMIDGSGWIALGLIALLYAVLRNLPWAPFTDLAP